LLAAGVVFVVGEENGNLLTSWKWGLATKVKVIIMAVGMVKHNLQASPNLVNKTRPNQISYSNNPISSLMAIWFMFSNRAVAKTPPPMFKLNHSNQGH